MVVIPVDIVHVQCKHEFGLYVNNFACREFTPALSRGRGPLSMLG